MDIFFFLSSVFVLLILVDVAAGRWGADSRERFDGREWERQRRRGMFGGGA